MTQPQQGQEPVQENSNPQNQGQQAGQEPGQGQPQQPQQGGAGQEPANNGGQQDPPMGIDSLPKWAQDELRSVRSEAAQHRTQRNELQQQFDSLKSGFAKALGLETGEPDPEQLSGQLNEMQSKYRQERIKNAFYQAANKHGADTDLAWSHLYASDAFKDLDVEGQDFTQTVDQRVSQALEAYPKLKADYAPTQPNVGGSGSNPGPSREAEVTQEQFDKMNYRERQDVFQRDPDLFRRLSGIPA